MEINKAAMNNQQLIEQFYTAFAALDAEAMVACYHPEIEFSDPAFGLLKGKDAGDMWRMLIERSGGKLEVTHSNATADAQRGSAEWVARYVFSQTGRPVINRIRAEFEFRDDKIIRHTDRFDLGRWARQAFGFKGWLISIFPALQHKIRQAARQSLSNWQAKHH